MNDLIKFNFEDHVVRSCFINGDPYWVGKDVATALGYSNTKDALRRHVDPEDRRGSRFTTPSGVQSLTVVNESGLYSLILSSRLETAKRFKRWITSEVLPQLRTNGYYGVNKVAQYSDALQNVYNVVSVLPLEDRTAVVREMLRPLGVNLCGVETKKPTVEPAGSIMAFMDLYKTTLTLYPSTAIYSMYINFCDRCGYKDKYHKNAFSYRLRRDYGIDSHVRRYNGRGVRFYRNGGNDGKAAN